MKDKASPRLRRSGRQVRPPKRIIGIGASAGGLEALLALLRALPEDPGLSIIFVQHLSPDFESALPALLSKATRMEVVQAEDRMPIEADRVYVVRPATSLLVEKGQLRVAPLAPERQEPRVIDRFFASLSEDEDGRGIGVLLSGTGTDGVEGLKTIKAGGGLVFAQAPESAAFDGMPRRAIASGCVDYVLPPEEIARTLIRVVRTAPRLHSADGGPTEGAEVALRAVLGHVYRRTGIDLSLYKPAALLRRLSRRMLLAGIQDLAHYEVYLRDHPDEVDALQRDLLIHVTSFFRDPETFDALKERVFPALLVDRPVTSPLRIWVAGCSTGEEVYSLLIELIEFMEARGTTVPIQVFGTDISEAAVAHARSGVYAASAVAGLSPARLQRFFVERDGEYQIAKSLREICVFSRHNLASDPPFSRLDLITCRNVLIYLSTPLQQKLLTTFHFALQPHAFLVLGSAEGIGGSAELYSVVDKKHRVFRKKTTAAAPALSFRLSESLAPPLRGVQQPQHWSMRTSAEVQREAERYLLEHCAPASLLVDARMEVVHLRGDTGRFLAPRAGAASLNVFRLLHEELASEVRALFARARRTGRPARREVERVEGRAVAWRVEVHPLTIVPASSPEYFLVLLEERRLEPVRRKATGGAGAGAGKAATALSPRVDALQRELSTTRRRLHTIIGEQEATNQELSALNEETQSTNEELQSTNEELETAKEELQSTNEELTTVNEELQSRNAELSQANNDLINLLASVNLAILMVDNQLRVRRFTPVAQDVLSLIPGDVGRPVGDLKPKLAIVDLDDRLRRVIDTLTVEEDQVQDRRGRWFSMRIRPYRTADNKIEGAVVALVDVDESRRALLAAERAQRMAEALLEATTDPLLVIDGDGVVQSLNARFSAAFDLPPREAVGKRLFELQEGRWNFPALRDAIDTCVLARGGAQRARADLPAKLLHGEWRFVAVSALQREVGPGQLLVLSIRRDDLG